MPSRPRSRFRALLLVLVLGPATGAGAGGDVVLRAGTLTEMEPLSPMASSGFWYGTAWTGLVHQPLLTTGADGRPAPCLARRWDVIDGNRALRFHLDPAARWHDGAAVTAGDVAFTLDLIRQHQLIGQIWRLYEGTEVVDDSTAVVRFREPVAYHQSLMFTVPPMLPAHLWRDVGDPRRVSGEGAMVGSGVFAFDEWDADARIARLRRADSPAVPHSVVDRVEVRYFADAGALWLALRRGDIDVVMGAERHVPPSLVDAVADEPGIDTLSTPAGGVPLSLVFHGEREPTSDPRFREAIALAVDGDRLVRTVLHGRGRVGGRGFVPPGNWTWAGPFPRLVYDAAAARARLDSLGFVDLDGDGLREDPTGAPFSLPLIPELWQSTGEHLRAAEALVYQLRQVGLSSTVSRHVVDEEYALLWEDRDYLAYVGYTTPVSTRDGGHVYFADYRDFSYGTFTDSTYHRLLDAVNMAPDEAAYLDAVARVQQWNAGHLPGLALAWGDRVYAWRADRFSGWTPVAGEGFPSYATWSALRPVEGQMSPGRQEAGWSVAVWTAAAIAAVAALALLARTRR